MYSPVHILLISSETVTWLCIFSIKRPLRQLKFKLPVLVQSPTSKVLSSNFHWLSCTWQDKRINQVRLFRGGLLPIIASPGRLYPKRGTFFWLQVYEREGILPVEVYARVEKSVISVYKMGLKGYKMILWLYKNGQNFLVSWFINIQKRLPVEQLLRARPL